jgi:hypothetical protein
MLRVSIAGIGELKSVHIGGLLLAKAWKGCREKIYEKHQYSI